MSTTNERVAWKPHEWGARYGLGRSKSYAIIKAGKGPRTIEIDGLTRITQEDDEEWRRGLAAQAAEQDQEPAG
jgi:hypothetical protein